MKLGLDVYRYPAESNSDPQNELDKFLSATRGCLITSHELFKGSEAENIVSIQISYAAGSNVRGTFLRAVSRLYVLNGVAEQDAYVLGNVINDDSLLYCFEKCQFNIFECLNCSKTTDDINTHIFVCTACAKKCHKNHRMESRHIESDRLYEKCACTNHLQ